MSFQKRNTHKYESKKLISQPVNDTSEQKYPKKMTTYLNKVSFKTSYKAYRCNKRIYHTHNMEIHNMLGKKGPQVAMLMFLIIQNETQCASTDLKTTTNLSTK